MVINGMDLVARAPIVDMASFKMQAQHSSFGLAEAGYDIRLKQDIRFFGEMTPRIALSESSLGNAKVTYGRFCLASAIEQFAMPSDLVGIVHDKSTWARHGLSVFNTVIEPNWRGYLTLELVYHGSGELFIPAGEGIAQVIFHQTSTPGHYNGKYQDQENCPVEAR